MIIHQLAKRLSDYKEKQLYRCRRTRPRKSTLINFSSNDYLALSQHPKLIKALTKTAKHYGVGSGASQLVTGHTSIHQECEDAFAEFLQRDRALLFGNGYQANLGVIDALTAHGDRIYQDRYNHASLLDGARLSNAKLIRYAHKNVNDLQQQLIQQTSGQSLIISDGVFSMHGDIAPLPELAQLCQDNKTTLMIDDAHGIGVLGQQGRGSLSLHGLSQEDVPILVCPLGKAFGVYGAIVAGSHDLIDALIQFSRSYIYTTAIPPALAGAALQSLAITQKEDWRREKIQALIDCFKTEAKKRELTLLNSETPIQPLLLGDPDQAMTLSNAIETQGFIAHAMRPPSVPDGQSLLRITLTSSHTKAQIIRLLECISHNRRSQ